MDLHQENKTMTKIEKTTIWIKYYINYPYGTLMDTQLLIQMCQTKRGHILWNIFSFYKSYRSY
jgi:hypothetical protein